MKLNQSQLNQVAAEAKSKMTDRRWITAIDRAVEGLGGKWIVTELTYSVAITTESGQTYFANGKCQCKAFENGMPCKHRAAARLIELYNEAPAPKRHEAQPRIVRSIERDVATGQRINVVRCDGWVI